jgi:hypothetical protein
MTQQPQNDNPWVWVFLGIMALGALSSMFGGGSSGGSSASYSGSPDRSSREYRYVEERMKLEGMSGSDARTAADAVMKFHEAQKARQR